MGKEVQAETEETMMDLTTLENTGCQLVYHYDYVGEPPNRERIEYKDKITRVYLALTPIEWCGVCMRDGDSYIGGCCGSASFIQDILNGMFRDSGWIDAKDFAELAEACQNHPDGFEDFTKEMTQKQFDDHCANWDECHPFVKLAVLWHGVKDKLRLSWLDSPSGIETVRDPDSCLRILRNGLQLFSWQDLFKNSEVNKPDNGQKHAGNALLMARILPAARELLDTIKKVSPPPFEGVAIYDKKSEEVAVNGLGHCLYYERSKAEGVIEQWLKDPREGMDRSRFEIRKVSVTLEKGIEYLI